MTPTETAAPGSGRLGLGADRARNGASALAHTDWLRNLLTVSGPAAEVAQFCVAARGTNAVP